MEIEVTYRGIKLLVEGTYTPGEKGYMYDGNLDGLPDSGAEFNIDAVFVKDLDIYNLFSVMDLEEIVELVLEEIDCPF